MDKKVLVVEDEYSINDILTLSLKSEGYNVKSVFNGKDALKEVESFKPDLILLDVMLPDMDGFEICKKLSQDNLIIIITARDNMFDKLIGLELGADDYICKPFEVKEVMVRIKVLFRSINKMEKSEGNNFIKLNNEITVDIMGQRVLKKGEEIIFKRQESALFFFLLNNRNRIFTREEILEKVWGYEYLGDTRTIDVHVRRIRAKLGLPNNSDIIETVFGIGYVMR